ncbi:MAG TPA: hypothetical protein VLU25_06525 [Acidobacteriota bacterium]|nr:hypothetical protein [Acidobacteriota bacterium]
MGEETTQSAHGEVGELLSRLAQAEGFRETDLYYRPESDYRTLSLNGSPMVDPFTGSTEVRRAHGKVLRPYAVVPPRVSRAQALEIVGKRLRWSWLAPGRIRREGRREDNLRGVLIPFWTFDFTAAARYPSHAEAPGGTVQRHFKDLLVPASQALSQEELQHLRPLTLESVQPFSGHHFSHFYQEHYSLDWEEAFQQAGRVAQRRLERDQREASGSYALPGQLHMTYSDVAFKLLLMPVWILAFPYGEGHWRALVDAQSGRLQAEVPRSPLRIAAWATLLLAALSYLLL